MPRNGLNESTSLPRPTVKVPAVPTAGAEGVVAAPGTSSAPRIAREAATRSTCPWAPLRCGLCPTPAPRPPVARRAPHDHVLHGVSPPRPVRVDVPRPRVNTLRSCWTTWRPSVGGTTCRRLILTPWPRSCGPRWWRGCPRSAARAPGRGCAFPTTPGTPETGTTRVIWRESRNDFAQNGADSTAQAAPDDDFAGSPAPQREVVLDVNTLDAGTGYLDLGLSIVSPDENLLAYSLDTSGDEVFTLRFRDLRTGADLPDVVEGTGYTGAWTSDSWRTFLYTVFDASWRQERVRAAPARHSRLRRRRRARRARPPFRGHRAALPQRAGDRGAQREPRHRRELVRRPRPAPTSCRARSAAAGRV